MPRDEPGWWYGEADQAPLVRRLLRPASRIYGHLAERRIARAKPYVCSFPVICAGNFTAGGTGKTPLSLFLVRTLRDLGETPVILTRGYGGRHAGPRWIDVTADTARDVGDEPLLLAANAPVMMARDRRAGAVAIEESRATTGASVIVMDDGLQNPALQKDLAIALVDGKRGVGNGEVIPAGPLRAPLVFQLGLAQCIVVNRGFGGDGGEMPIEARFKREFTGPVLAAHGVTSGDAGWLKGAKLLAYAGIANPGRFFSLIEAKGGIIAGRRVFADHHAFTERDAAALLASAEAAGAGLITTEKDFVRLPVAASGALGQLRRLSRTLPIAMAFDERNGERLRALIAAALKSARGGTGGRAGGGLEK